MKRLGEILIEHGSINVSQLEKALDFQKEHKEKRIGEILIQMGWVTEEDIVVALAMQFNFAYLPLENITVSPDVRNIIPVDFVRRHCFIPIDKAGGLLTVTMADPSDEQTLKEIEKMAQCKVQAFVSTVTEIENAIQKYYGQAAPSRESSSEKNVSQVTFKSVTADKKPPTSK